MVEYRKLERDGHCSLCGEKIKANNDNVRIVQFFFRSQNPKVNICDDCAYDIFYAPILADEEGIVECQRENL